MEQIKVLYVNNEGGGFADVIEVDKGTDVGGFFKTQMEGSDAEGYVIRVNKDITPRDRVLQDGDSITITPAKIGGSR